MSDKASSISPLVLVWARERSGLSIAEASDRLGKDPAVLEAWEHGEKFPTYNQLEELAERIYKRPVALFFLPEPPDEDPAQREFRTLPHSEIEALDSDSLFALRDAKAFQDSLRELTGGRNPAERLITRDIHAGIDAGIAQLASTVRDYLRITLQVQQSWHDEEKGMANWRDAVESVGIFVFKRSFKQKSISGFCLSDGEFPVIVINNGTSFTRQAFTLFHELSHLLFGVSSITSEEAKWLSDFSPEARAIETVCNQFSGEFLVPSSTFPWSEINSSDLEGFIAKCARQYKVSREVILRKLVDRGLVNEGSYSNFVRSWAAAGSGRTGSGGNYYATQATYLGGAFLRLAFSQYRAGTVSLPQLSEHLRIKARNIGKLEDFFFSKG